MIWPQKHEKRFLRKFGVVRERTFLYIAAPWASMRTLLQSYVGHQVLAGKLLARRLDVYPIHLVSVLVVLWCRNDLRGHNEGGGGVHQLPTPLRCTRGDGDGYRGGLVDFCVRALHAKLVQAELDPIAHRQVLIRVLGRRPRIGRDVAWRDFARHLNCRAARPPHPFFLAYDAP